MGAALLTTIGRVLDTLGEAYRARPDAVAQWHIATNVGQRLSPLLSLEAQHMRETIRVIADRYEADNKADRTRLVDEANAVLDELETVCRTLAPRDGPLGELAIYLDELSEAFFAAINAPEAARPCQPAASDNPLLDFTEVRLSLQAAQRAVADRPARLRMLLAENTALGIEKILLALRARPELATLTPLLRRWLETLTVSPAEPDIGATVAFSPDRHACRGAAIPGGPVEVLTWGVRAADGSLIRPAIVSARQRLAAEE
jgi:hypothetical protein